MAQDKRTAAEMMEELRKRFPEAYRHIMGLVRALLG